MQQEGLESWALQLLANGQGMHGIKGHPKVDEVYIGWGLETPDRPLVVFRQGGKPVGNVEFEVRIVPAANRTDHGAALKEIKKVEEPPAASGTPPPCPNEKGDSKNSRSRRGGSRRTAQTRGHQEKPLTEPPGDWLMRRRRLALRIIRDVVDTLRTLDVCDQAEAMDFFLDQMLHSDQINESEHEAFRRFFSDFLFAGTQ
jgi:hypothetical protein